MDPSDTKYVGVHLGSFPGPMGHFLHKLDGSFSPSRPSYLYHGRYQGGNRLEMKKLNGHLGVWSLVFAFPGSCLLVYFCRWRRSRGEEVSTDHQSVIVTGEQHLAEGIPHLEMKSRPIGAL